MEPILDEKLRSEVVNFIARHPGRDLAALVIVAHNTNKTARFMELLETRYDLLFPEADIIAKKKKAKDDKRVEAAKKVQAARDAANRIIEERDERDQMLKSLPEDI